MNTSIFNVYEEKSGQARSRKPSQPGRQGSYEEALIETCYLFIEFVHISTISVSYFQAKLLLGKFIIMMIRR